MAESKIQLPTSETKAERVNPSTLVIYGNPKSGKTSSLVKLPNHLLIDYENGSKFVDGVKIAPKEGISPIERIQWLRDVAKEIKAKGKIYDYIIIDSFSEVDSDCEFSATEKYMNTVQGKKFNRNDKGERLTIEDSNYSTVHDIGEGYGYKWSRAETMSLYEEFANLAKICTIYVVHVADTFLALKNNSTEVVSRTLSLTGKLKQIVSRKVDAIGYVYSEDDKIMISFESDPQKLGGNRAKHVAGYNGVLDWNLIFIKEK